MGLIIFIVLMVIVFLLIKSPKNNKKSQKHFNNEAQKLIDDSSARYERSKKESSEFFSYREQDKTSLIKTYGEKNLSKTQLKQYENAQAEQRELILAKQFYPPYSYKLKEARTVIRKEILESIKLKNEEAVKNYLNELYYYSVLVAGCYGATNQAGAYYTDEYCEKVGIQKPEDWLKSNFQNARKIRYEKYGKLNDSCFLSETDWKRFEKYLGVVDKSIHPKEVRDILA